MKSAAMKVPGGKLLRASVELKDERIARISITGDFFLHPEDLLPVMERLLVGQRVIHEDLAKLIEALLRQNDATLIGASPGDLAKVIVMAATGPES